MLARPQYVQTEVLNPITGEWEEEAPFVYADGTNSPPALLRDEADMNFLSPSIRAFGLTLMAIGLVSVFLCTLWVYLYQDHSVVIAAQPLLLYSLCLGSTMVTLAILMSSYDESYIDDEETLSRLCNASVWLDSLGHMIAYGALFTKVRSTWCTSRVFFLRGSLPEDLLFKQLSSTISSGGSIAA